MLEPFVFSYFTTFLARDVVFYTITTISTSIASVQNIEKFVGEHNQSDLTILSSILEKFDLVNRLMITTSIIKDIVKKHSNSEQVDYDKIFSVMDMNFLSQTNTESDNKNIETDDNYQIIDNVDYNKIVSEIPEPVKMSILSTLESIHKINKEFDLIYKKIIRYTSSYFNFYKLDIGNEKQRIISLTEIFNSRLNLMLSIVNIYSNEI
jgi:hypothetical protein